MGACVCDQPSSGQTSSRRDRQRLQSSSGCRSLAVDDLFLADTGLQLVRESKNGPRNRRHPVARAARGGVHLHARWIYLSDGAVFRSMRWIVRRSARAQEPRHQSLPVPARHRSQRWMVMVQGHCLTAKALRRIANTGSASGRDADLFVNWRFPHISARGQALLSAWSFVRCSTRPHVVAKCPELGGEADRNPLAGGLDRVAGKVGVAGGRLDIGVAEMPGDHRQAFAEGEAPRGKAVAEVMNPHLLQPRFLADDPPACVQIAEAAAGRAPRNHPRVAGLAGQGVEDLPRRRRQWNHASAGLRIAQSELFVLEVDVLPLERHDLVAPASGQHQQAQGRGRDVGDLPLAFQAESGKSRCSFPSLYRLP